MTDTNQLAERIAAGADERAGARRTLLRHNDAALNAEPFRRIARAEDAAPASEIGRAVAAAHDLRRRAYRERRALKPLLAKLNAAKATLAEAAATIDIEAVLALSPAALTVARATVDLLQPHRDRAEQSIALLEMNARSLDDNRVQPLIGRFRDRLEWWDTDTIPPGTYVPVAGGRSDSWMSHADQRAALARELVRLAGAADDDSTINLELE